MTRVDASPIGVFADGRLRPGGRPGEGGTIGAEQATPDARRERRRQSGSATDGDPAAALGAAASQAGERAFDRRLQTAQAARVAAVYEAEALSSLIYQMGGAPRPSAKGTYVDIRV